MKVNYHTHTARCMHATGEDEEYVRHALKAGFEVLGFADHVPWPFASGYVSPIRMPMSEMEGYIASVTSLRERYAGQIDVRLGFEAEYFPRYRDHLLALRDRGVSFCWGSTTATARRTPSTRVWNARRTTACAAMPRRP